MPFERRRDIQERLRQELLALPGFSDRVKGEFYFHVIFLASDAELEEFAKQKGW
jgi:hypothetical protein